MRIYGTSAKLATDGSGNYRLDDVAPGEITLQVSGGGYMPQQRIITVKPGELSRQDFRMSHVSASVDVVESLKEYHLEETSLATRTPTRLIDLPQSVQVYPKPLRIPLVWGLPRSREHSPDGQSSDRTNGTGPDICEESGVEASSIETAVIIPVLTDLTGCLHCQAVARMTQS